MFPWGGFNMTLRRPKNMADEDTDESFGRRDDTTPVTVIVVVGVVR